MKLLIIALCALFSSLAFSMEGMLNFEDQFQVKKIVVMDEILINDLIKLHNDYDFEGDRMIAGKFEVLEKKTEKKTYLEGLRGKLGTSQGPTRL